MRKMKIKFNPDGSLEVLEDMKKKKTKSFNTIILKYEKEEWGDVIDCKFIIMLPKNINEKNLKDIENWVDQNVKTDPFSTNIEIERLTANKFSLVISGKGKDNRCVWCRSFRTSLKKLCDKNNINFIQENFCKFEKE